MAALTTARNQTGKCGAGVRDRLALTWPLTSRLTYWQGARAKQVPDGTSTHTVHPGDSVKDPPHLI